MIAPFNSLSGSPGAVSAVRAWDVGGDVGADEARTAVNGMSRGWSLFRGGAGGSGRDDGVDEQQCPGLLPGEFRGVAAQRRARAADGLLQVKNAISIFHLPA